MTRGFVFALGAAVAVVGPLTAQHDKHQGMGQDKGMMTMMMETPWREMNGFHSLLHLSHRSLMSGDLAPARRNAGGLADAAEVWAKSTAPSECKAPADTGDKVTAIATDARAFATLVDANGTDDEVKVALGKLHDAFEAAHMTCMPMGKGMKGMEHRKPPQ
jgi:hypothetical protein